MAVSIRLLKLCSEVLITRIDGSWRATANTLTVAAICSFVAYITDLVGRRYVVLLGSLFLCIGSIVVATAHSHGPGVVAMALGGAGAGICELTAFAG